MLRRLKTWKWISIKIDNVDYTVNILDPQSFAMVVQIGSKLDLLGISERFLKVQMSDGVDDVAMALLKIESLEMTEVIGLQESKNHSEIDIRFIVFHFHGKVYVHFVVDYE